jgi:hypothetical protein
MDNRSLVTGVPNRIAPRLYLNNSFQLPSVRDSEPSPSSYRPSHFSDIRTRERNTSMDTNAFVYPGGRITEDACAKCVTECQDASCTVPEKTSQCTDQCVVVACNDPSHGEMSCHGAQHCDVTCDNGADCPDCNGFEEFVSCIISNTNLVCKFAEILWLASMLH